MSKRRSKGRPLDGILLLDKPQGLSSNDALQKVKRIFFAQKAGHTGALDPLATGMLPICFGEATKFSQYLLDSDKGYRVIAKLGVRTDTSDADGEVVATRPVTVTPGDLLEALDQFRGPIMQVPSMYSALKYQGKPLYKYAREGIEVPREARPITVYKLTLVRFEGDEVEMDVECSKGTYIRTIVDDLGEVLGCGAHVTLLRRTKVSGYPVERMVTLERLEALLEQARTDEVPPGQYLDGFLLPMDSAVQDLPAVDVQAATAFYLKQGQAVQVGLASSTGLVRIVEEGTFIGVGELDGEGKLAPKRMVVSH
ncbi:tRNA pseudouridine(55) synthase TruB [Gallaecimonas xiamenensis]|uniref:tRNA pseudouridine synthase B n=1 Tax=Gallaecimonas xiamenensis 3-C-1 TaxID=745411 RepID=K2JHL5_9GAMM|nr:tRNA pseudouridine(55) synthase TruB [Gallaecimonas xiamenensis]EKE74037.1 tRNA pseudouridine synthase B [Gallaecimonas xiamenensis 3-C-1]